MRKVLYFLGEISDQDIDWISGAGTRESIVKGTVLVEVGRPLQVLTIILQGRFSVSVKGVGVIAEIGTGEIVGELSFLDARPPSATVCAVEDSIVWNIAVSRLTAKLRADLGFASRFYRALGVLLAHRMRERTIQLAYGEQRSGSFTEEEPGELDVELLDKTSLAATRFDRMLEKMLQT